MCGRSILPACCLLVLAIAATGCRSTGGPTPTFARADQSQQLIAATNAPQSAESAAGARPRNADTAAVHVANGTSEPVRESPLSRLIGRFGKPKAIPLPRTDIKENAVETETAPAGDLASAF
jgi:hypothetical protein